MPDRLDGIRSALGGRSLAWFGTRGVDALGLWALAQPRLVASQVAAVPKEDLDDAGQDCLELRLRRRVDLDRYDIDLDLNAEARGLKTQFLSEVRPPLVVIAYRSAEFLSAASFCDPDLVTAFNFHLFQRQFEHKPWVERALARVRPGIAMVPTCYVRDTDQNQIRSLVKRGPMVGRTSSGSGGAGVFLFDTEVEFAERLPQHRDGFVAVSPFLGGAAPININACVYDEGVVAFGVSMQLIGVRGLTSRRFGFCGNDFLAVADFDAGLFRRIEEITFGIGEWLRLQGYRGLFGLDLLIHEGQLFVSELNARFQASTSISTMINQALGLPDPITEHVAAFLGMAPPCMPSLAEQAQATVSLRGASVLAQVFHRNVLLDPVYVDRAPPISDDVIIDCVPDHATRVDPEAVMFRSLHRDSVTRDGYSVSNATMAVNAAARRGF